MSLSAKLFQFLRKVHLELKRDPLMPQDGYEWVCFAVLMLVAYGSVGMIFMLPVLLE